MHLLHLSPARESSVISDEMSVAYVSNMNAEFAFDVPTSPSRVQARLPGDCLLDRRRGCQRCNLINGGPGAFAVEVALMTNVSRLAGATRP